MAKSKDKGGKTGKDDDDLVVDGEVTEVTLPTPMAINMGLLAHEHPDARRLVDHLLDATPKGKVKRRPGPGGTSLSYAPWGYTARQLVRAMGTYTFELVKVERSTLPPLPPQHRYEYDSRGNRKKVCPATGCKCPERERDEVIAYCRIVTPWGAIQDCVGSSTYYPNNPDQVYGDVIQAAMSYALRRGGARWGIALDLYDGDDSGSPPTTTEETDALAALRSAIRRKTLTESAAVARVSKRLTGDAVALQSVDDCITALALDDRAEAIWGLIALLDEED